MRSDASRPTDHVHVRANQRERAVARAARITTATAVAGSMATIGFAGLAAMTFSGNTNTADAEQVTPAGQSAQDQQAVTQTSNGSSTNSTNSTPTARATAVPAPTTNSNGSTTTVNPPAVSTNRRSHVTTGGSH